MIERIIARVEPSNLGENGEKDIAVLILLKRHLFSWGELNIELAKNKTSDEAKKFDTLNQLPSKFKEDKRFIMLKGDT